MDFLNKAFAQFNDLFRSMTPGGRITTGLLLIVAVVSVGYLFQSQVGGGDDYLFGGKAFETPTLIKMEGAFGTAGLIGYTFEGGRVKVPRAQRDKYVAALAAGKALPAGFGDKLRDAGDNNLLESPKQREERHLIALEQTMTDVINSLGVEGASVLIDRQPQSGGIGLAPIQTASVAAQGIGGVPLDEDKVDMIRHYVAAAVAGMKPENVTIADAYRIYPGDEGRGGSKDDAYARAVRNAEQELTTKIRQYLSYIPGVMVTSLVTLDQQKNSHILEIKNDKGIPVRTREDTRDITRESTSSGGAPGLQSQNGGAMAPASLGKGPTETNSESKTEQVMDVNKTSTETEKFGLTPKLAKVSIGVPASYYEKVWQGRNPPKEGEEAKKPDPTAIEPIRTEITKDVTTAVANLLPTAADVKDPTSLVTVTTFQDIKAAAIPSPAVTQRALSWLGQSWPMLAMVGLVLFSLGVLRSILRSVPAPSPESSTVSMRVSGGAEPKAQASEEPVEATAARRLRRMSGSGPSLRDELSEFVKEDPDSAANILRTWIGQVS